MCRFPHVGLYRQVPRDGLYTFFVYVSSTQGKCITDINIRRHHYVTPFNCTALALFEKNNLKRAIFTGKWRDQTRRNINRAFNNMQNILIFVDRLLEKELRTSSRKMIFIRPFLILHIPETSWFTSSVASPSTYFKYHILILSRTILYYFIIFSRHNNHVTKKNETKMLILKANSTFIFYFIFAGRILNSIKKDFIPSCIKSKFMFYIGWYINKMLRYKSILWQPSFIYPFIHIQQGISCALIITTIGWSYKVNKNSSMHHDSNLRKKTVF